MLLRYEPFPRGEIPYFFQCRHIPQYIPPNPRPWGRQLCYPYPLFLTVYSAPTGDDSSCYDTLPGMQRHSPSGTGEYMEGWNHLYSLLLLILIWKIPTISWT